VTRTRSRLVVAIVGACASGLACADPMHDEAVRSLGPEDPHVAVGPLHRPGQPCLTCHGGSGPASGRLSLGGTVYAVYSVLPPTKQPALNAVVEIEDIDGRQHSASTNAAGNFFVLPGEFTPHYPIQMKVSSSDGAIVQQMQTFSARAGSCADCHTDPQSPTSPGPVYLSTSNLPGNVDGGTE
jgi:hypothetical protein